MQKYVLIFGLIMTFNARAECNEAGYFDCGDTGDVKWYVSEDQSTLTISGNGDMENYATQINPDYTGDYLKSPDLLTTAPWVAYKNSITKIDVQDGVKNIGDYAFLGMEKVIAADLPNGLKSIGRSAFNHNVNLQNMDIPSTVTTLGYYVFQATGLTSIMIGNNIKKIGPKALAYNPSLQSIIIGDGVTSVSAEAFEGTKNAYIYCQDTSERFCRDLIGENNPGALGKLKRYTVDSNGKIKVGSKTYDSFDDLPKYVLRRIYTLKEAEEASGKVNRVSIRYR